METLNSILDYFKSVYNSNVDIIENGIPYFYDYTWYWLLSKFVEYMDKIGNFILQKIVEWGLVSALNAAIGGIPSEILGTLGFLGFDTAIKIILGAYVTKLVFSRLMSIFI